MAGEREEKARQGTPVEREDLWREHEANQRASFGEGPAAEDQPSPEMEQAGAASRVTGGGPIGTPQGPKAASVRAAHLRADEGPADLGEAGQTEEHGDDAPRGRGDRGEAGEGKALRDARQRWPPV